jgi:hypothetical protein
LRSQFSPQSKKVQKESLFLPTQHRRQEKAKGDTVVVGSKQYRRFILAVFEKSKKKSPHEQRAPFKNFLPLLPYGNLRNLPGRTAPVPELFSHDSPVRRHGWVWLNAASCVPASRLFAADCISLSPCISVRGLQPQLRSPCIYVSMRVRTSTTAYGCCQVAS